MDLAIVVSLVGIVAVWIVSKLLFWGRKKSLLLPGPIGLPIIGHLHLLGTHPHQTFQKLSHKYGPLMQIRLGSVICVVVSSPNMAREVLKTQEQKFASRPVSAATKYVAYDSADFTFAPYGPYWKFMKKLCMTELLGSRQLDQFMPVRAQEMMFFLETIMKSSMEGKILDVGAELASMANNVISRMAMSTRCSGTDAEAVECRKLVKEVELLLGTFNLGDYIYICKHLDLQGYEKQMKDVHRRFDSLLEKILEKHEAEVGDGRPKDLIDILFSISKDEQAEMKLTRDNIKGFILDLFAAATDTSTIATEWALSELIKNPHVMDKARQEIDHIVGTQRLIEESDIPSLPYLQSIVKESLRLHPPGPMTARECIEDCILEGYHIPAKTRIFVNIWAIGRDPDYWENPSEFIPERFDGDGNIDVRGQYFHLLPFGSGRRGCPGTSLALFFVHTAVGAMIQCFDWKVVGNEVDMEEGVGMTLPRANPLRCVASPRFDQLPKWKT